MTIRLSQTGKSKHYGFIEFDSASVAKIVAETMDNYLLNGHIMQCKVIPKDKVHPQLWVGANRKWRTVPPDQLTRAKHNKVRSHLVLEWWSGYNRCWILQKRDEEEQQAATKRLLKRQNQRKRKLEDMGINYNFEEAGYVRFYYISPYSSLLNSCSTTEEATEDHPNGIGELDGFHIYHDIPVFITRTLHPILRPSRLTQPCEPGEEVYSSLCAIDSPHIPFPCFANCPLNGLLHSSHTLNTLGQPLAMTLGITHPRSP